MAKEKSNYKITNFVWKILCSVDSKYLKLTKIDDTVYSEFQEIFKDFQCGIIDVDDLKSNKSKEVMSI